MLCSRSCARTTAGSTAAVRGERARLRPLGRRLHAQPGLDHAAPVRGADVLAVTLVPRRGCSGSSRRGSSHRRHGAAAANGGGRRRVVDALSSGSRRSPPWWRRIPTCSRHVAVGPRPRPTRAAHHDLKPISQRHRSADQIGPTRAGGARRAGRHGLRREPAAISIGGLASKSQYQFTLQTGDITVWTPPRARSSPGCGSAEADRRHERL